jgi:hypothetical protein
MEQAHHLQPVLVLLVVGITRYWRDAAAAHESHCRLSDCRHADRHTWFWLDRGE